MLASGVASVGYPCALLNAFPRDDHVGLDLNMVTSTACICSGSCFCRSFTDLSPALSINTFQQTQRRVKISINAWGHGHPLITNTSTHSHWLTLTAWDKSPPDVLLICWTDTEKAKIIEHNEQHRAVNEMSRMWVGYGQEKQSGRRGRTQRPGCPRLSQVFRQTCLTSRAFSFITKPRCQFVAPRSACGSGSKRREQNTPPMFLWVKWLSKRVWTHQRGCSEEWRKTARTHNHVFSFTWKEENNVRWKINQIFYFSCWQHTTERFTFS